MVMENDDECDDDDDADDNEGGEKWKLRGLAMRKLSVLPFVCPSVCQTCAFWQNGRKICPHF